MYAGDNYQQEYGYIVNELLTNNSVMLNDYDPQDNLSVTIEY